MKEKLGPWFGKNKKSIKSVDITHMSGDKEIDLMEVFHLRDYWKTRNGK